MKFCLSICISLFFLISCSDKENISDKKEIKVQQSTNFDWLLGTWKLKDSNRNVYEIWQKNKNVYYGFGFTLKHKDTVSKEILRIFPKHKIWIFNVTNEKIKSSFTYRIKQFSPSQFVGTTNLNNITKQITYKRLENKLLVEVVNDNLDVSSAHEIGTTHEKLSEHSVKVSYEFEKITD